MLAGSCECKSMKSSAHKHVPLYAHRSVKFEEDIVSSSRSDGPEEVLSQVRLL